MTPTLEYAPPSPRREYRNVRRLATLGVLFPLLIIAVFYGEYFLAWAALGHPPRPNLDDPKDIAASSWLHYIVALLLVSLPLEAGAGIVLNILHASMNRPPISRIAIRFVLLALLWLALYLLLHWDPGHVLNWWFD